MSEQGLSRAAGSGGAVRSGRRRALRVLQLAAPLVAVGAVLWLKPMGLLLWARLRILTNIPRTAIAEDPPQQARAFPDLPQCPMGPAIRGAEEATPPESGP
jgi:hypothetical protein